METKNIYGLIKIIVHAFIGIYILKNIKCMWFKFENQTYFTPDKWINIENCYKNSDGILLDSLEIFQISINYNKEENEW